MIANILLGILFTYMLLGILAIIFAPKVEPLEMFEGKPRYTHLRETGYHFSDDVYYDHKENKEIIK